MKPLTPNTINWFEIPVADLERAMKFYTSVFQCELNKENMDGCEMAIWPANGNEGQEVVHGALMKWEGFEPSDQGSLVYFNCGEDLQPFLDRVAPNGGSILKEKMSIGPHGHIAMFKDSEGNRVAMHSAN